MMNTETKEYVLKEVDSVIEKDGGVSGVGTDDEQEATQEGTQSPSMSLKNLLAGLTILAKYYDNLGVSHVCVCQEEELCADATDKAMSPEDVEAMVKLGWFQYRANKAPIGFTAKDYRMRGSWTAYV